MKTGLGLFILFVGFVTFMSSYYVVTEGQQAIITQFGKPVGESRTVAGPYLKLPFIQEVRYVDKRILTWDGYPNQIPTRDKKYISVDTTARFRVVDALLFIQTVKNEQGARDKLDAILDASTRNVISNNNLVEAVRNSNEIIDKIKETKLRIQKRIESGEDVIDEEVTGEIAKIKYGREKLSQLIAESADKELAAFGIKLIDVQLRRISYEKTVEAKVYERMISERKRIAQKLRAIGRGEKQKIEGRITKDLRKIESESYRKAQEIKGKGEAKAAAIYSKALGKSPKFYSFIRSMEAYKKTLNSNMKFLLSSDSEFLRMLKGK